MTVLCGESIRLRKIFEPFHERTKFMGLTFGLGPSGYDVRIAEDITLNPGGFCLGFTLEHFTMPRDVMGVVHDKSTWARQGLALQNTVIEPGWRGYLTLEFSNHGHINFFIEAGTPIAQVVFHLLDRMSDGYSGKYQDQKAGPQGAIYDN